ncbi:RagB/SusD family nutrient uptake outer membrane protein [Sphingobacterium sp. DK4209]|uniref:RagB/SusD family nutrient uptake outer membrane protein n=1 Tax=Sphingobacterium zhuxiongii TaxID=2662364 RepID=A0A5Q0QHY8_9SPHI|nr:MULTISPECIES: RagB/SusD family nutrient uptake outer membrane protein [unclassified Sphingobacterium]MVZ64740.1 RagB/SusD family nutrient uptake outer membrane protein [Sphingobacterium sp. DK4209]QGA27070.1 RagB/SusD family nutrient uptake outer membrane protein [Sphingobacterium sp. dk4302]
MKKRYLSIFIIIALFTGSCSKLNEEPTAILVNEQFYLDEAQAIAGLTGTYRKLYESGQSLYNGLFQIGVEMATDDYEAGPRARNAHVRAISNLTHDPSNDRMEQLWKQSYDAINASNLNILAIEKIAAAKIDANIQKRLILEAKFLRALHYFNLVRWFGGVPLQLVPINSLSKDELYVSKSSEEQVYAQIIKDLLEAEALPNYKTYADKDKGRATSGAAKSLLAKVYLTQKDYANARAKADEVITQEGYSLFEEFADVFDVEKKNGKEHIFSAQFKGNSGYQGNSLAGRSAPADIPGINGDYADALHVQGGLYASYENADTRLPVTFTLGKISPVDGKFYNLSTPQFNKYYDESVVGNQSQSSKNTPIIRYAEVLLIFAEAENEIAGPSVAAQNALNTVRKRANATLLTGNLSKESFRDAVFEERRKELVYEYQRWFDLVRRGADYYIAKLKAAGKSNAAARHLHFPTPQRELNLNPNLKQHPDWINH